MKKLLGLSLLSGGFIFALACTPADTAEDAGTARADAGTTAQDAGSTTHDAAGTTQDAGGTAGTWVATKYGERCSSDADCPGGSCIDLFQGQNGSVGSCFKNCTDAATDCADFPYNVGAVQCASIGGSPNVCIIGSGQNGPCGNVLNTTCTDENYGICGMDSSGAGTCVRGCNMSDNDATTSNCVALPAANCGCLNGDGCSDTLLAFGTAESYDGVCAPVTSVGDTCGFDSNTLQMTPCTDGQECAGLTENNPTGSCAEPSVDGGMVEDAG